MNIVDKENVRGQKGEKYIEYRLAIRPFIANIHEEINRNETAIIERNYLMAKMGKYSDRDFIKKNPYSVYLGLRHVLYPYAIDIKMGTYEGEKVFVMTYVEDPDVFQNAIAVYAIVREEKMEEEKDILFYNFE